SNYPSDLLPSAIAGVSFDKDDFEIFYEVRNAFDGGFDVAALVSGRDHDARRDRSGRALPQRAADRIVPQAKAAHKRQGCQEAIDNTAESKQANRKQQAPFALDRLEIGKRDQRGHIGRSKDVLWRLRHLEPGSFGRLQSRKPKMREIPDDEARLARTQAVQML